MLKRILATASAAVLVAFTVVASAQAKTATVAGLKTAGTCNDEYKANKGALKDAKEKKKDFIAACRALAPGMPTPIGTAAAAPPPSAPASASAPAPAQTIAPKSTQAAPAAPSRAPGPTATVAPTGANRFAAEAGAKARCPSATVVWVNTKSKV